MAGGKLTPRQKMINLMYLVFIAMLALNMSKEVLSAFGILNNKIVESNRLTDSRNESSFQQLAQKASFRFVPLNLHPNFGSGSTVLERKLQRPKSKS